MDNEDFWAEYDMKDFYIDDFYNNVSTTHKVIETTSLIIELEEKYVKNLEEDNIPF